MSTYIQNIIDVQAHTFLPVFTKIIKVFEAGREEMDRWTNRVQQTVKGTVSEDERDATWFLNLKCIFCPMDSYLEHIGDGDLLRVLRVEGRQGPRVSAGLVVVPDAVQDIAAEVVGISDR